MAKAIFERGTKPLYRVWDGERLVLKRCSKCHQHKSPGAYQKDSSRKLDGLMNRCRVCEGVSEPRPGYSEEEKAEAKRRYQKKYREKHAKPDAYCECGALLGRRNWTGVCRACQKVTQAKRRVKLARRKALIRRYERHAEGTAGTRIWAAGVCPECGEAFVKPTKGIYCTTKCRRRARHHIRRVIARSPDSIDGSWQVYDRDNYICWLCNEKCDPNAHYLDPTYPTLDHVIPVSLGGTHTMDNLRTAHRHCNSTRTGPGQGR